MWLKWLFGLALIGHGIGHLTGVMAAWIKGGAGFKPTPWIFSPNVTITSPIGKVFSIIWLAATVVLVLAGVGLLINQAWWLTLAIAGAVISIIAIFPWWNTVVPGAKAGFVFNLLVLIVLLTPLRSWLTRLLNP